MVSTNSYSRVAYLMGSSTLGSPTMDIMSEELEAHDSRSLLKDAPDSGGLPSGLG